MIHVRCVKGNFRNRFASGDPSLNSTYARSLALERSPIAENPANMLIKYTGAYLSCKLAQGSVNLFSCCLSVCESAIMSMLQELFAHSFALRVSFAQRVRIEEH